MFKKKLIKLHHILSQFGIDPHRFLRSLKSLPQFIRDYRVFKRCFPGEITLLPCLYDRHKEGGTTKSEYFWQDLLVAGWIHAAKPHRHVDIGSRVDGFVAHVASFRDIEVFDLRPISTPIPSIIFRQADLMCSDNLPICDGGYCDSLSCLHAIEHFGLGRYGDPIDPIGHIRGITNMSSLIKSGGTLYLSSPVGRERVEFNANRVLDPRYIVKLGERLGLHLQQLTVINGSYVRQVQNIAETLQDVAHLDYNLGIFVFKKQ